MKTWLPILLLLFPLHAGALEHAPYDAILKKYVHHARVSYAELLANKDDLANFRGYLKSLSETDPATLSSVTARKVFWINAYNAFTIELILQNYPVASIRKISGPFGSPWKRDFFAINGKKMSLDDIEHGILRKRKEFLDARVHFALVCASKGCPPLQSYAFSPDQLDDQLEKITHDYLTDPQKTPYDSSTDKLGLISVMKWYGSDFERDAGSLWKFVKRYRPQVRKKTRIEFLPYDWSLNDAEK